MKFRVFSVGACSTCHGPPGGTAQFDYQIVVDRGRAALFSVFRAALLSFYRSPGVDGTCAREESAGSVRVDKPR